jgi:peptidoglycan/LPS O-acetylase OafA/YrhL
MDVHERWRRASESVDRFSAFRRRRPILIGLTTAFVALITLAIFLWIAGLEVRQFWSAALVSTASMMLAGYCLTLIGNRRARSSYIAEYRRLNNANTPS